MKDNPFTFDNLMHAADCCKKGVSWKENVCHWMFDKVSNCLKLEHEIATDTYRLCPPTILHITCPKPRVISAMKYRDRVVQRAMCECGLYDDLTHDLIYDNCACQKGKGVTFAIKRMKHYLHKYYNDFKTNSGWVVRLDIRKYFPSIPHELLKEEIRKRVNDPMTVKMVNMVIDDTVRLKDGEDISFNTPGFGIRGIGIGSQLSQLMALCYLSDLDHFIAERADVNGYIRYMDDMIMFTNSKNKAYEVYDEIKARVEKKGLQLNPKSKICRLDQPIEFLKIIYRLTDTGVVKTRGVRASINRELRRINTLVKMFKTNHLSFDALRQHTATWFGYAKHRCSRNQIRFVRNHLKELFNDFEKITPDYFTENNVEVTESDISEYEFESFV